MSGKSSPEYSEEAISRYLQDLGMLEDGMTSHDKRNLWMVIKISQDTAKAEEEDRQEQARQALQFDQVSARAKSSSESEADPDGDSEEVARSSPHETEDTGNGEKKPAIGAVLPQLHATPMVSVAPSQHTAATVVPVLLPYEGDVSQNRNTPNSGSLSMSPCSSSITDFPENQDDSASQDSQSPPRHVGQLSVRRCLRSNPNVEMKAAGKMSPINDSSVVSTQKPPFSVLHDKQGHELQVVPETQHVPGSLKSEHTDRTVMTNGDTLQTTKSSRISESCEYVSMPSSPVLVVESPKPSDPDGLESSVSHVQVSSSISRIQHSLKMSHYRKKDTKERSNDKSEVNEDCCEENNISALRQEGNENMGVENCASVFGSVDNVPSPLSDTMLNDVTSVINCNSSRDVKKKDSEDQERNINPFDCDRSNYEWTLKVQKVKRTCSRQPFYIPPFKMDVDTYISYFKRSISEQTARLIEVQQRNHKCVPWGEPIVVGESSSRVMVTVDKGEQKNKGLANLQGHNFRDHKVTYQQVDNIYEDPDMQSNDDIFFTDTSRRKAAVESQQDVTSDLFDVLLEEEKSVHEKEDEEGPVHDDTHNSDASTAVDRQGTMKRKSDSSDDQTFDQEKKSSEPQEKRASPSPWLTAEKEEVPPVAVKRKKFGQVVSRAESAHSCGDLDGDFEPAKRKKLLRQRRAVMSYTRKKTWINGSSNQSQSIKKGGDVNYDDSIFDDFDSGEGVGDGTNSYPVSFQETEIIRPGRLKLRGRGRRLFHHNQLEINKHGNNEYKESDTTPVDDITVVYDVENSCADQDTELVPCPICRKTFATKDIEAHASECSEYCEEELQPDELHVSSSSTSSQMVKQSSEGSVTEKHWNEFDNEKEFEGEDTSTIQTRQQRPQTCQGTATSTHTSAQSSSTL